MAWSKSTRIKVMLVIDIVFFLVELIVGFAVHSLALMADAFHMLNDIISLFVGLWAVGVASKATTDKYSYGWVRAEILGAFFNAVFLIALCVTIILEAITRLIDPPDITNAQLILVVGCFGLASNLVGFLVLGGHGHSHGPGEHAHGDEGHDHAGHEHSYQSLDDAEEGRAGFSLSQEGTADESGRAADHLPEAVVGMFTAGSGSRVSRNRDRRSSTLRHSRLTSIDDISIHPASFRQEIIAASQPPPSDDASSESSDERNAILDVTPPAEDTPLLGSGRHGSAQARGACHTSQQRSRRDSGIHRSHNHNKPRKPAKSHGHSHGDMGMNAMILHVLGDALGNAGVIVAALIIWKTDYWWKMYSDPAVSLFITLIILNSCIPLTKATSKILLQATPDNIDLNEVKEDIQQLPGVLSCHHVHIWQLSDTKIVASLHIQVAFPISEASGARYMELAKSVRKCLHGHGIHSATIQPEFCQDANHDHEEDAGLRLDGSTVVAPATCGSADDKGCLLDCVVDDCVGLRCCSPSGSRPESSHSHGHDHENGHSHDGHEGHSH